MRGASAGFLRALSEDKRNYILRPRILPIGRSSWLELENEDIWFNGISVDDAVSNDDVFEIGGAIINQATVVLNNIDDKFSPYNFDGALVDIYLGLPDEITGGSHVGALAELLAMGRYTVTDTKYNDSTITLTCQDNMRKFDAPYHSPSTIWDHSTIGQIVAAACRDCSVTLATTSFPNSSFQVPYIPSGGSSITYRQVISWCAQIAGCFARCNSAGKLEIKFYDFSAFQTLTDGLDGGVFDDGTPSYSTGDTADGGSFNPWNTGYAYDGGLFTDVNELHFISSAYSYSVATDDVVVTGVRVVEKVDSGHIYDYANAYSSSTAYVVGDRVVYNENLYECVRAVSAGQSFNKDYWRQLYVVEYFYGTSGYVITIEGNELIHGKTNGVFNGDVVAELLGTALIGLSFRKADITHPNNPNMEAGDVAVFYDRKGNRYNVIVSSTIFRSSDSQNTTSSAETPQKNSQQRYTAATENYVALRRQMSADKDYLESLINGSGTNSSLSLNSVNRFGNNGELSTYDADIADNVDTLDSMLSAYDTETENLFV